MMGGEDSADGGPSEGVAAGHVGDPAALAAVLAKDEARLDPVMAARVAEVLEQQSGMLRAQTWLLEMQAAELATEDSLRHWSLRVRHLHDVLKVTFALSGAFLLLVAAVAVAALIWDARNASGLVFQPLKAPPDFSARGLDGSVLAQELLDRMNALVVRGDKWSFRSADTISGNWGDNSKVEIPETGVSVAELSRYLHQELGHETSMSGELTHTSRGIALTVRVGSGTNATFDGDANAVTPLLDQAAHALLAATQSYRYLWVLYDEGHPASNIVPIARHFLESASPTELPWLQSATEQLLAFGGDFRASADMSTKTIALAPNNPSGYIDYAPDEWALGHLEPARRSIQRAEDLLLAGSDRDFASAAIPFLVANCRSFVDDISGAYADAVQDDIEESRTGQFDFNISGPGALANDMALDHDPRRAQAVLHQHSLVTDAVLMQPEYVVTTGPALPEFFSASVIDEWRDAKASIDSTAGVVQARHNLDDVLKTFIWPWQAYADARVGQFGAADALLAKMPMDCTLCLEVRGRILELRGDDGHAIAWYRRAIVDAPSLPFARLDLARLLMRRHDFAGAERAIGDAHQASPHNADALELWGEALIVENRSDLALARFEEANRWAPNWGRLHIKWGEALLWLHRRSEALAQFALASRMAASRHDLDELERVRLQASGRS